MLSSKWGACPCPFINVWKSCPQSMEILSSTITEYNNNERSQSLLTWSLLVLLTCLVLFVFWIVYTRNWHGNIFGRKKVMTIGIIYDGDGQNGNYHLRQHFRNGFLIFYRSLCLSVDQWYNEKDICPSTQYPVVFFFAATIINRCDSLNTNESIVSPITWKLHKIELFELWYLTRGGKSSVDYSWLWLIQFSLYSECYINLPLGSLLSLIENFSNCGWIKDLTYPGWLSSQNLRTGPLFMQCWYCR